MQLTANAARTAAKDLRGLIPDPPSLLAPLRERRKRANIDRVPFSCDKLTLSNPAVGSINAELRSYPYARDCSLREASPFAVSNDAGPSTARARVLCDTGRKGQAGNGSLRLPAAAAHGWPQYSLSRVQLALVSSRRLGLRQKRRWLWKVQMQSYA